MSDTDKRIGELEAFEEIREALYRLRRKYHPLLAEHDRLKAENERLWQALEDAKFQMNIKDGMKIEQARIHAGSVIDANKAFWRDKIRTALAAETPSES